MRLREEKLQIFAPTLTPRAQTRGTEHTGTRPGDKGTSSF